MSTDDRATHRRLRQSLGAWVLGALDGDERHEVSDHVATCPDCAAEVAELSPLPGLLGRLSTEEATDGSLVPSPRLHAALAEDRVAEDLHLRRRVARWRTTALVSAAAAVVALVVVVSGQLGEDAPPDFDRVVAAAQPVAAEAAATDGEAAALAWEWGTTVELDVTDLPSRDAYVLWAVSEDGVREQAGTWGTTDSRGARVRGASSIQRDDLARVEVTDASGEVLVSFAFTPDPTPTG
ncbi:anti-sigma factor family protein [Salsipaludibacter albus]|uniref:anti-sigma factor family protein n=1 Tax=Salsipaludibacter albus TaxID=2849650 RepID=UPI001EE4E1D5|nr:zf-HC2 domain-containing protein [Salsipaludibacter albus]MBY5164317.1 zf-HC2 domain-containing protein [Salsipaludibacter albus]